MNSEDTPPDGLPIGARPPAAEPGVLLEGRYRLGALIGRGGTAEVYRARDELLGRDVAVKVFDVQLTDLNTVARQRSEMRALAALSDPHLIAVHDARLVEATSGGSAPERSFLVMELVNGGTLADRLHDGPMAPAALAPIAVAVAGGLAAAHAHGLVHRDIKPANVLIAATGAVKLGDFGLARMVATETPLTSGSMLAGTAAYFSPEQAGGEQVGAPTDIYALGLVLLEAVSGRREFPGAPVPSAMARLLRDPEIPDGLPAPWPTLLLRMTDRDPSARPTAADVVRILTADASPRAVVETVVARRPVPVPVLLPGSPGHPHEPVTAAGPSILSAFLRPEGDAARKARRRNSLLAGAGALVAAVVLVAVISVSGEPTAPADASPVSVQRDSSAARSLSGSGVTTAPPSTSTAARTAAPRTTAPAPAVVEVKASTPAPTVARTSTSASVAASRAAASRAAAVRSAAARSTAARSAAARAEAARVVAARAEAARVAARAAERAAADRAAARAAAERAAADRTADKAPDKAAEKAADAARKAAEKQQKQAGKDAPAPVAPTAAPGPGDQGGPGKKP